MQITKTTGLVLKSYDQGERDRIYLLFTADLGKIIARAHGVRSGQNLLSGHLSPWLPTTLVIKEKQGIYTIADADTDQAYSKLGYQLVARLHLVAELVDRLTGLVQPDKELMSVLTYASQLVTTDQLQQLSFVEILAKTLEVLGIAPSTHHCVVNGAKIDPKLPIYWSGMFGGVIQQLPVGFEAATLYRVQHLATLKLLNLINKRKLVASKVKAELVVVAEAEYLLLEYMQIQVQQNLKALPFIHSKPRERSV